MDVVYPQALVETPLSVLFLGIVCLVEILSLIFAAFAVFQFRRMLTRHTNLCIAIDGMNQYAHTRRELLIGLWTYIIFTVLVTGITVVVFLFQPHIF